MRFRSGPVRASVPATSANLGPGFDSLGLALALTDEVTARVANEGITVEVRGEGAGEVPTGADHLIVATMLRTFSVMGVPAPPGLALSCHNRIPHARGLGSSSAAIVSGVLLARALVVDPPVRLDDAGVLALAADIEGHPDNVAPCLLGGFTIAWQGGEDSARAVRLDVAPTIRPVVFVPATRGLTAHARAALPAAVPYGDAIFNVARTALLVHALTVRPELLLEATADRLHQDYRAPGMPQTAALLNQLRAEGYPAFVSGAGPTIIALIADGTAGETSAERREPGVNALLRPPEGWWARSLSFSSAGSRILILRHAEGDPVAAGPPS